MITTLLRAGLRTRLILVGTVALTTGMGRLAAFVSGRPFAATEMQNALVVVTLWLVIPTFAAMLGSALLRGEHGPWSWLGARPLGRARAIATLAAYDAIALAACAGVAAVTLEGLPGALSPVGIRGNAALNLPVVYALLYMAAAIGGARKLGSARAVGFGVLWVGVLAGATAGIVRGLFAFVTSRSVRWNWIAGTMSDGYNHRELAEVANTVVYACTACVVVVGVVLPFLRTAAVVPGRPRWRRILVSPLATLGAVVLSISVVTAWAYASAPWFARQGSAGVLIRVESETGTLPPRSWVTLGPVDAEANGYTRSSVPRQRGLGGTRVWSDVFVAPGPWRACHRFLLIEPNPRPYAARATKIYENCVDIEVGPESDIVDATIVFEPRTATPAG